MSDAKNAAKPVANPNFLDFAATVGTSVERKLGFKPRLEHGNLTKGFLVSAEVAIVVPSTVDKTGIASTYEYAGMNVPVLKLTFVQEPTTEDPAERTLVASFSPFSNRTKNNEEVKPESIAQHYRFEYDKLRHIANAFTTHPNFDASVVPPGFNPYLAPIERLKGLTAYYEAWAKMFNGKDGGGFKNQMNWIKIVADSQRGTYLTLPDFVGQGFIEKAKAGIKPVIELKPGETVELISKAKGARGAATAGAASATATAGGDEELSPEIQALVNKYK